MQGIFGNGDVGDAAKIDNFREGRVEFRVGLNGAGMLQEFLLSYIAEKCRVDQTLLNIDGERYRRWLAQQNVNPGSLRHILPRPREAGC